jgi:predicted nucleic acid-binding protein
VKRLRSFLAKHHRIAIDSCIFIYYLEANPQFVDLAEEVFVWLERAPHSAVTSTLTMTEILAHPYWAADDEMANKHFSLLSQFPNLEWVAPDLEIADTAARLRAIYRLRTPDALQVPTAVRRNATVMLTNDSDLVAVKELEVLTLTDLSA